MKINKDIIARDIHGDTVLLNIKTGDYFSLNAVGTDIFYCLQEGKNESETITCLLDKYDVDSTLLMADTSSLIKELKENNILITEKTLKHDQT